MVGLGNNSLNQCFSGSKTINNFIVFLVENRGVIIVILTITT